MRSRRDGPGRSLAAVLAAGAAPAAGRNALADGASARDGPVARWEIYARAFDAPGASPKTDVSSRFGSCRLAWLQGEPSRRRIEPMATTTSRPNTPPGKARVASSGERKHRQRERALDLSGHPGAGLHGVSRILARDSHRPRRSTADPLRLDWVVDRESSGLGACVEKNRDDSGRVDDGRVKLYPPSRGDRPVSRAPGSRSPGRPRGIRNGIEDRRDLPALSGWGPRL